MIRERANVLSLIFYWRKTQMKKRVDRPPLRVKPIIEKINGRWLCSSGDTSFIGVTPEEAYRGWCRDVAMKYNNWSVRFDLQENKYK